MTARGISLLLLLLSACCSYGASGPQVTVTVSPKGIANGLSVIRNGGAAYGPDSTNGAGVVSTTCGIQEALDSLFYTNALGPVPGSGRMMFQNGVYEFSGQIVINDAYPFDLVWEGQGKVGTILKYTGTDNAIIDSQHANLPKPRFQFTVRDMGFAYVNDTSKKYLMLLWDVNECRFERCLWCTWGALTANPYSTLNYINSVPLAPVGIVGARIGLGADNKHVYENCTFYGLASGLWDSGDHISIANCMFANCGFNAGTGFVNSYAATVGASETNILSLGSAINLTLGGFEDVWIRNTHFHFCNCGVLISAGTGVRITDCIWEGSHYGTLVDADSTYSVVLDEFTAFEPPSAGDAVFNLNTGVIGAASTSATHWRYDSAGIASMLDVSVGASSKLNLSSVGVLTANGSGLTALNAANITSGTLPNGRLVAIPNSALANSSITVNGTSVSLGGSVTAPGYTICLFSLGNNSMAAATTYYYGQMSTRTINTTYSIAQIDIPRAGTIKRVYYKLDIAGTLGTAGQNVTHTINVNNTTDCASSAFDYSTAIINQVVSGVSQAVSVGDTIALKVVTPGTWTTPATSARIDVWVYIE